jgi:hypothetical protein
VINQVKVIKGRACGLPLRRLPGPRALSMRLNGITRNSPRSIDENPRSSRLRLSGLAATSVEGWPASFIQNKIRDESDANRFGIRLEAANLLPGDQSEAVGARLASKARHGRPGVERHFMPVIAARELHGLLRAALAARP